MRLVDTDAAFWSRRFGVMQTLIRQFNEWVRVQVDDRDLVDLGQPFYDQPSEGLRIRPEVPVEERLMMSRVIVAKEFAVRV